MNRSGLSAPASTSILDLPLTMKPLALATFLAAGLVGCTNYDTPNHGRNVAHEPMHNFLGIIKIEPGIYANNEKALNNVSTKQLYGRRADSGDRITLLWGAVTITDY